MTAFNFSLLTGETGPLVTAPTPNTLNIPLRAHKVTVNVNDRVLTDQTLATAQREGYGDVHAPSSGIIKEITPQTIILEVTGQERIEANIPDKNDSEKLREDLRQYGVNVEHLIQSKNLIINAVPPEPGISIYDPLLRDYRKTIELGLETVSTIIKPTETYLVAAKGNMVNAFANCTILHVPPTYPNGIDQLVIKAVTGKEVLLGVKPNDTALLSVRDVYFIGKIMETGRPVTETVLTIGKQNQLVKIGTPVGHLCQEAELEVKPGDRVLFGGYLRGIAALNLQQGVEKSHTAINVIRQAEALEPTTNFCLGCGACEKHCPSRIMPGMISRCAEFKQFERAENFHIHSCIECGLCGYWCKAQRPLLQYIRLAKWEIALLRSSSSDLNQSQSDTDLSAGVEG